MGGGNPGGNQDRWLGVGLSPRGRGKHPAFYLADLGLRSIPAWAGETWRSMVKLRRQPVYPRVGGGNQPSRGKYIGEQGLSPRGRGKRHISLVRALVGGSIPAWAGETCRRELWGGPAEVYPRVGGGNLPIPIAKRNRHGLSPRGRGKLKGYLAGFLLFGSIPAWAGETQPKPGQSSRHPVYPRVGGGNHQPVIIRDGRQGLSPRGRGKPPGTFPESAG